MAFAHVWGNFILSRSYRKNPLTDQPQSCGFHLHYKTTISCSEGSIPAVVRVYQVREDPALPEDTVAFVFGKFKAPRFGIFEIEAINLFPYPSITERRVIFPDFLPRFTVVGHVVSNSTEADDGTRIFPINTIAYVRDDMQVTTILASISPSRHWPAGPPVALARSPVHITGPLDRIDPKTRMPVITVEDVTFDVGDRRIAEMINEARLANYYRDLAQGNYVASANGNEDVTVRDSEDGEISADEDFEEETMRHEFDASRSYIYANSKASFSSVPPFPNPLPLPLDPIPWPEATSKHVKSYPPFGLKSRVYSYDSTHDTYEGEEIQTPSSDLMCISVCEDDTGRQCDDDVHMTAASEQNGEHSREGSLHGGLIHKDTVYLEDIRVVQDDCSRYKKKATETKPVTKSSAKRKKLSKPRPKAGFSAIARGRSQGLLTWAFKGKKRGDDGKADQGREAA